MKKIFALVIFTCQMTTVKGHGRLIEPPGRSTAFRFGFSTPENYNDMELNCGGFTNQWYVNHGLCGICGDPYQGPRENEAGGKYATGTIVRQYTEGQTLHAVIELTAGHGGWSEFRICPNNDVTKPATQQCLDRHLLATPFGSTRIEHAHIAGRYAIELVLPTGLVCTQCVFQWKWITDQNNNCNKETGENCCNGCGLQEQFYGCADISVRHADSGSALGSLSSSQTPIWTSTNSPVLNTLGNNYQSVGYGEPNQGPKCTATEIGRSTYGVAAADQMCQKLCVSSSTCPENWCRSSCRLIS